jgi:dolichol-phosphate mannosyltransferase
MRDRQDNKDQEYNNHNRGARNCSYCGCCCARFSDNVSRERRLYTEASSCDPERDVDRHKGPKTISIVIPCYNEQEVLKSLFDRLNIVIKLLGCSCEVIFVDDGSVDSTRAILLEQARHDPRVRVVVLSRNFGHQGALTAGLDHARGEVVLIMDADLQDPPELLPQMIEKWRGGADVVYGQRSGRIGESWFKRGCAFLFYRVFERIIGIKVPRDTGDFRLLDRRAVRSLLELREPHRFVRGMVAWVGFRQEPIFYERPNREHGETKYPFRKSFFLAIDAITSFSYAPLRLATYLGVAISGFAFFYIFLVILLKILIWWGLDIQETPGYTSLMACLLLLGGVQLIVLGLIGEYVGRIFEQGQNRPLYLLDEVTPPPHLSSLEEC